MPSASLKATDIKIRPYLATDFPQIREHIFECFATGENSVGVLAKHHAPFTVPAFASYLLGGAGLFCVQQSQVGLGLQGSTILHVLWLTVGMLLITVGTKMFLLARHGIWDRMVALCEDALATDLSDIPKYYALPSIFLVATVCNGDSKEEKLVGCGALQYNPLKDSTTAEIRRMLVHPSFRRHGIASCIIEAILTHMDTIQSNNQPCPQHLDLTTSDHQPDAQRLYQRFGWKVIPGGRQTEWGPWRMWRVILMRYRKTLASPTTQEN
ncbi:hypothetical protein C8F01DRAFT_1138082 [Mycena amicta]|nr:hypothetical protein C8F01DRAFT_1138082 [Mycena amicta]